MTIQPALAGWLRIVLRNWAARRFDWRKQAMSRPAKAISRGPAWPVGTPGGNVAAGGAAARADEPMPLIFGDDRLDLGEFPDLVAQRLGIGAGERPTARGTRWARTG